ncbi:hypothetical protein B0J11DRAFT_448789 [Dendryphion nanum]|uniref:Uncharacterized protein n=1 Tax=Dendryphion nanum TaxID=256645 RepID=A0A9P9CYY5_9PLEO|nr:hypothetical protein B0J11DRAFT_448789 [Dendryphion nanum]
MRPQRTLVELDKLLGGVLAGTLLCFESTWRKRWHTDRSLRKPRSSKDWARKLISHVAQGGRTNNPNGTTPIWERATLEYDGQLIAFYSDQCDSKHSQKLVCQAPT